MSLKIISGPNTTETTDVLNGNILLTAGAVLRARGIINGDVRIEDGCRLELHGIMNGSLVVDSLGIAEIRGVLTAESVVDNGDVTIWGIVTSEHGPQNAEIKSGAILNGKKY